MDHRLFSDTMNCRGYFAFGWVSTREFSVMLEELLGIPVGFSQVFSPFEERHEMFISNTNISHHCYSGKNGSVSGSVSREGRKREVVYITTMFSC